MTAGERVAGLAMVWGWTGLDVAAVLVADGEGRATVWVNERLVGAEPWLVAAWARRQVAAGWRFGAVRLDKLRAVGCAADSA